MRKNDCSREWASLVALLELRPGEVALDMQTEPDMLLPILHHEVTDGGRKPGRAVGMNFGKQTLDRVRHQIDGHCDRAQLVAAHPASTPFKPELFHGVVLRHNLGLPTLSPVLGEIWRISKPGARVAARHTEWQIKLPRATEREQEMIDALTGGCCADGRDFFAQMKDWPHGGWRDLRLDVFTAATRDDRHRTRHAYDWRTMLKDQVTRTRRFTAREILDLIDRLQSTRGAKVVADRYMAVGVKP